LINWSIDMVIQQGLYGKRVFANIINKQICPLQATCRTNNKAKLHVIGKQFHYWLAVQR